MTTLILQNVLRRKNVKFLEQKQTSNYLVYLLHFTDKKRDVKLLIKFW